LKKEGKEGFPMFTKGRKKKAGKGLKKRDDHSNEEKESENEFPSKGKKKSQKRLWRVRRGY